jgi:hypothetical protein
MREQGHNTLQRELLKTGASDITYLKLLVVVVEHHSLFQVVELHTTKNGVVTWLPAKPLLQRLPIVLHGGE